MIGGLAKLERLDRNLLEAYAYRSLWIQLTQVAAFYRPLLLNRIHSTLVF